jgi:hypothetical protein
VTQNNGSHLTRTRTPSPHLDAVRAQQLDDRIERRQPCLERPGRRGPGRVIANLGRATSSFERGCLRLGYDNCRRATLFTLLVNGDS